MSNTDPIRCVREIMRVHVPTPLEIHRIFVYNADLLKYGQNKPLALLSPQPGNQNNTYIKQTEGRQIAESPSHLLKNITCGTCLMCMPTGSTYAEHPCSQSAQELTYYITSGWFILIEHSQALFLNPLESSQTALHPLPC